MYEIKKDGGSWCATGSGFINLQESLAGFGATPIEALEDLRAGEKLEEERRREGMRKWKCNNCKREFSYCTLRDRASCPKCKAGDQYVKEVEDEPVNA